MDGYWYLKKSASQRLRDNLTPELVEEAVKYHFNKKGEELNEADREHIARLVKEGYIEGELVHESAAMA